MSADEKKLLKVGIISDIQALPSRHEWGMNNFKNALSLFSEKGADLLVNAGDIAEGGDPETYALYWELIEEHFPNGSLEHISCEGNHDCSGAPFHEAFARVCRGLRRECINPEHRLIGGYDFITFATFDRMHYAPEELPALEREIEKAVARDPEKPVFVITHFPPANTVAGSHDSAGSEGLFDVFKKFPQVVSLSGHTHYPLADERCIWQGEFTAVQTSTLAYGCMSEDNLFNTVNGILPFAREVTEAIYMELYADRAELHRYNVTDKRELGPLWQIPIPYVPAAGPHGEARSQKRQAPGFADDAEILLRFDYGYAYIIFDRCVTGDHAQYYDVEISEYDEEKKCFSAPETFRYVSDFYRFECNRQDKLYFKLPGTLKGGTLCRFRVYGVESFGKRGAPLEMEFRLWKNYKFKDAAGLYPQE